MIISDYDDVAVIVRIAMALLKTMNMIVIKLIVRGFPVTSLPCNNTIAEVWNTNLKVAQDDSYDENDVCKDDDYDNWIQVQTLCMIEAPTSSLNSGLLFKSFFTSVISNIFGVTR